jgi:hypothetical protein
MLLAIILALSPNPADLGVVRRNSEPMLIAVQMEQYLRGERLDNDEKQTKQLMEKKVPLVKDALRLMAPRHRRALTFQIAKTARTRSVAQAVRAELRKQSGRLRGAHNKVLLTGMDWKSEDEDEWQQGLGAPDTYSDSDEEPPSSERRDGIKGRAGLPAKELLGSRRDKKQGTKLPDMGRLEKDRGGSVAGSAERSDLKAPRSREASAKGATSKQGATPSEPRQSVGQSSGGGTVNGPSKGSAPALEDDERVLGTPPTSRGDSASGLAFNSQDKEDKEEKGPSEDGEQSEDEEHSEDEAPSEDEEHSEDGEHSEDREPREDEELSQQAESPGPPLRRRTRKRKWPEGLEEVCITILDSVRRIVQQKMRMWP